MPRTVPEEEFIISEHLKAHATLDIATLQKMAQLPGNSSVITKAKDIKRYRKQLKKLLKIPLVKQKSPEWYELRQKIVTASDFAQALGEGKFGTQKQFIMKKCDKEEKPFASNPFFDWGNMFEQVASDIYAAMNQVKMYEFGLIPHPRIDFFGASPDGISNMGIMLEIKCPLKRKLVHGEVPKQYYYQIQGQLDVCDLEECDYFECELGRWESWDEYRLTYQSMLDSGKEAPYTGYIVEEVNADGEKKHRYSKVRQQMLPQKRVDPGTKVFYWILKDYNCVRVKKDPVFVKEKMTALKEVWDNVLRYRENEEDYIREVKQVISLSTETFYSGDASSILNNDIVEDYVPNKESMFVALE